MLYGEILPGEQKWPFPRINFPITSGVEADLGPRPVPTRAAVMGALLGSAALVAFVVACAMGAQRSRHT